MILYHPFFDRYHCAFRLLRLISSVGEKPVELDRIRAWDFYLLFPLALNDAKLPASDARRIRKLVKERYNYQYEILPDLRTMMARLEPIQQSALAHLASRDLINSKELKLDRVIKGGAVLPEELQHEIEDRNTEDSDLLNVLTQTLFDVPLYGLKGIRQRSDLFDCRYDPI